LLAGSFVVTVVEAIAPAGHLANIYRRRANHLITLTSPHDRQLASDVADFCARVERLDPRAEVSASEIRLDGGRLILLWEALPTRELLGVFSAFDQRVLSSD